MALPLLISCILAAIALTFLVIGYLKDSDDMKGLSGLVLLVIVLFGFGMVCSLVRVKEETVKLKSITVAQTDAVTLVEVDGKAYTFTDAATYNKVKTNTHNFVLKRSFNSYGCEVGRNLVLEDLEK